jgi:hypothetical protein
MLTGMEMHRREFLRIVGLTAGTVAFIPALASPKQQQAERRRPRGDRVLPIARSEHATALLPGGKVLVIGGMSAAGPLVSCQVYDPDEDAWYDAAPLATPRSLHSATHVQSGEVLVLGGYRGAALHLASFYDPIRDRWESGAPLLIPRYRHAAQELPDGRIVLTGGFNIGLLSEPEVYLPR